MSEQQAGRGQAQGAEESARERRAAEERRSRRMRQVLASTFACVALLAVVGAAMWQAAMAPQSLEGDEAAAGAAQQAAEAAEGTHVVVDVEGRQVAMPDAPQAVAVLDSFCGELAVMAGAGEQLCGAPGGVKSDVLLVELFPGLPELPSLSGNAVNIEQLLASGCDAALVRPTLAEGERAKLDSAGIPYAVVGYEDVEGQMAAMDVVGAVLGGQASERIAALRGYYGSVAQMTRERAAQLPAEERLRVYHSINDALLTDGASSLGADWIALVGCVDVSGGQEATSGTDYLATLEQVYSWDPDLVICNTADARSAFLGEPRWQGLRAVGEGSVELIPTGATRWGQRGDVETYLAMLWLGCTAYPELYADVDLEATVRDYYRDYLGIDVDDALYAQMLAGEGLRQSGTGDGTGGGGA